MSIEALLSFFDEKQGNYTRYLHDINRQPDKWQERQEGQGVV
ncbi:MAG: hypothetical protein ACYDEF_10785 [Methanosarcina sp.]